VSCVARVLDSCNKTAAMAIKYRECVLRNMAISFLGFDSLAMHLPWWTTLEQYPQSNSSERVRC
jgi:hypothetical protein